MAHRGPIEFMRATPLINLARCLLLVWAIGLVATSARAAESTSGTLAGPALLVALRAGGLILYFRHTSTDFGQNDEQMTGYENCASQRNLTDRGRSEAKAIGDAIKRLAIPVGEVLASPFCRTMETARLIFGQATASTAVRGGPAQPESAERYAALRKLLSTTPPPGVDLVIVSHGNPFVAVVGPPYLAEGEAAVIRPLANGEFAVIGRIPKDGWMALAAP